LAAPLCRGEEVLRAATAPDLLGPPQVGAPGGFGDRGRQRLALGTGGARVEPGVGGGPLQAGQGVGEGRCRIGGGRHQLSRSRMLRGALGVSAAGVVGVLLVRVPVEVLLGPVAGAGPEGPPVPERWLRSSVPPELVWPNFACRKRPCAINASASARFTASNTWSIVAPSRSSWSISSNSEVLPFSIGRESAQSRGSRR